MKKRNVFKKVALLGATAAMVMGMATNVMAAQSSSRTIEIGSYGYVDCYIGCNYDDGSAVANTSVVANYTADRVTAYVWLELDVLVGSSNVEFVDQDENLTDKPGSGANAAISLSTNISYNTGIYVYSDHEASIDGETNSCSLTAEDY